MTLCLSLCMEIILRKMRSAAVLLVVLLGISAVQSQEFEKSLLTRLYNELAKRDDTSSDVSIHYNT